MHVKYCSLDVYFIVNWLALFVTLFTLGVCVMIDYIACVLKKQIKHPL